MFDEQNNYQQSESSADNVTGEAEGFTVNTDGAEPIAPAPFFEEYVETPERIEKKAIYKTANVIGIAFILLEVFIYALNQLSIKVVQFLGFDITETINILNDPAVRQFRQVALSIIGFCFPFIIVFKIAKFRISELVSFNRWKKGTALPFVLIGFGICMFSNIVTAIAGAIFESQGVEYSVDFGSDPKGIFGFMLTFLSTVVTPALVEEFICRGLILGSLKKFGETFAILISALLFGIMHGNFEQIPFAFLIGIGLGFMTVKSGSIWPAVIVHALNNSVSVLFTYLPESLPVLAIDVIYILILTFALALGILGFLIIGNKKELLVVENKTYENSLLMKCVAFIISVPIILFVGYNLYTSLQYFV